MNGLRSLLVAGLAILVSYLFPCNAFGKEAPMNSPVKADFHVSAAGNDRWSGRLAAPNPMHTDGPFATLERARDAVRGLLARHPGKDVLVLIRGGTYRLTRTVVFSLQDSAAESRTITYANYPGEVPVFTSGVPIEGWTKVEDGIPDLPAAARGKVWTADVSDFRALKEKHAGKALSGREWRFLTLYDGLTRLPRARSKGFSPTQATPRGKRWDPRTLHFPKGAMRNWPRLHDAELVIVPCFFWTMNILPLESVDEQAGVAKTLDPCTYPMGRNGMVGRPSAWVENLVEFIDEPGEWALDTEAQRIYLWPRGDRPGPDIVAPLLTELVRVEGQIDYDGPTDKPVRGLVFRGLTFQHGDRQPWHGRTGWGLQHDWEQFDRPTALVRMRGATRCTIEDCHFRCSSHTAIRLDLYCQNNRVAGNHIEHVGGVGILLAGYGPGTKDVNKHNDVSNNYIHHVGELYRASAGIFAWQSGENRIAHNHIHHTPYTGLVVSGRIAWDPRGRGECSRTVRWKDMGIDPLRRPRLNWYQREKYLHGRKNIVEHNDIHHVMQVLGDGNCIYVSGTGAGNVVRENFCHNCTGAYMNAAIRCDDDQHETRIERNVIYRTCGEGIISKGKNDIINNVIADLGENLHQRGYIVFPYGSPKGSIVQRNILYSCRKGQTLYFEGRAKRRGPAPRLRDTNADYNLYFCPQDSTWGLKHLETERTFGIERHSRVADPRFADPDRADFRFRPGSPALELGIKPLDPSKAGLEPRYERRFIGRRITTRVSPRGREWREPITIAIEATMPAAEIRYTLDGTEPARDSPRYTGPFVLKKPGWVKAKSYAKGATDFVGAAEWFPPPPAPIAQDFEGVPVGEHTPGATTQEENDLNTARVTDEQAASGRRSLKFVDGPGQKHRFNPHVFFRTQFKEGRMVGRFAARLDAETRFYYQWRDYRRRGYSTGPTVTVLEGGKLTHRGQPLLTLPAGQWIRFEVLCVLGDRAAGTFGLKVWLPGQAEPKVFPRLECDPAFKELDWVGFVPNGEKRTVFYVDDIEVRPIR